MNQVYPTPKQRLYSYRCDAGGFKGWDAGEIKNQFLNHIRYKNAKRAHNVKKLLMAESKKRSKQMIEDDLSNESEIAQLADVISEGILERNIHEMDAFELYAYQLRLHLHMDKNSFKTRFSEGYRILVEELEKEPIS